MKLKTLNLTGSSTTITVSDVIFGAEINQVLLAQAIRVYRACLRQGTSKTKTRAEINRTHKKWFKQKGTGNARHGARTPNIFVGGGVSHGPTGEQNWLLSLTQTMKRQALISAFSAQAAQTLVGDIPTDAKKARKLLASNTKTLVILEVSNLEIVRGIRNMSTILITTADRVNALDVVGADRIVLSEAAIDRLEARIGHEKDENPVVKPVVAAEVKVAAVTKKPAKAEAKPAKATKVATKTATKPVKSAKPATKKVAKKA